MRYKLKLYLYPTNQEENPKLHSCYELNAKALPAFRDLAKSENCFLTHEDETGKEEFFEISTATEETNRQLRQLFFLKYFLKDWSEKDQLDWLKTWLFSHAEKQILCQVKN